MDATKSGGLLPESLTRQLREFERRLLQMETLVAVLGGLCGFLLTYGILFFSDRLGNTPGWGRMLLTLSGGAVGAGFCWSWLHHWWWRRRDAKELARLVQKRYGRLGDRLLGAVELAEGTEMPASMSPALCRAAVRQVAEESTRYDFKRAAATRWPRITAIAFAVLALVVLVPSSLFPQAGWNALLRWGKPFSNVDRYTFVSVEAMPSELVVPHGEAFEIGCALASHSRWNPARATCRVGKLPPIESRMQSGKAWFQVPGQTGETTLTIRLGDLAKDIRVRPVFRPELVRLVATISLPEYLGRGALVAPIESGRASFLAGSRVRLTGTVSRELRSASLKRDVECRAAVQSNTFVLADVDAGAFSNGCSATWIDTFGLSGAVPYVMSATVFEDESPRVECRGVDRAIAILQDEVVKFEIRSEDDYGIREMWVDWNSDDGKEPDPSALKGTQSVGKGAPDRLEMEGTFEFSPIACRIPEETTITLYACATDYFPGRQPARSAVHRIYVLSKAKHAQLLREQLEALQARIEERAREEERLLEKSQELRKLTPEELAEESRTEELKESQTEEQENAEQTAQLSEAAQALLKEALRNTEISEATLREWAELAEVLSKLSQAEMKEAAKALGEAAAQASERSGKLGEAVTLEEDILKALRKMEKKAQDMIQNMRAQSLVNRLQNLAEQEKKTGRGLQKVLRGIEGLAPADLPDGKKMRLARLAQRQEDVSKEAGYVQDDLLGFYNHTRVEDYGNVHKDMVATRMGENLQKLTELIRANHAMQVINGTAEWSGRFLAWAELLKKKGKEDGGESDGEAGDPDARDQEVVFGLIRARQREESLRDQTRLVEESRANNDYYLVDAEDLGVIQGDIAGGVRALEKKATDAKLRRLVHVVGGEMKNAEGLLRRPQTDAATIAVQNYIIELLSFDPSGDGGKGGSSAAMSGMAKSGQGAKGMGTGAGKLGGGNTLSGTTDKANAATGVGGVGEAPEPRAVDKAGGVGGAEWPDEFRDSLGNYFRIMEDAK